MTLSDAITQNFKGVPRLSARPDEPLNHESLLNPTASLCCGKVNISRKSRTDSTQLIKAYWWCSFVSIERSDVHLSCFVVAGVHWVREKKPGEKPGWFSWGGKTYFEAKC